MEPKTGFSQSINDRVVLGLIENERGYICSKETIKPKVQNIHNNE